MRAATEVGEGAVGVQRDGLELLGWARYEVVDQLDLVILAARQEARPRIRDRDVLTLEVLRGLDVRAHPVFDRREVGLGDGDPVGELEVVVEALLDRRPDRDLHARIELHHGGGEHVRGVVADQPQRLLALRARGEDRDRGAVGQRPREVAHLGSAPPSPPATPSAPRISTASAARARPAPIAAAASAPVAPSGSSRALPSGRVTVMLIERWRLPAPTLKPAATTRRRPGARAARGRLRPARSARARRRCDREECFPAP